MNETEALSIITRRLQPGETLVWYGVPRPFQAAGKHLLMLAFVTVWIGIFVSGLMSSSAAARAPDSKPFYPAIVVAMLIFVFGSALWFRAAKRAADCWRRAYGLTNRRIIIAAGKEGPVNSYSAAALADMTRTGDECEGSIEFNYGGRRWSFGGMGDYSNGLYGIGNPARVEALIYETLLQSKKGAAQ